MPAPWSAFPVATFISNADLLAAVQGGVNVQLTRVLFNEYPSGEFMEVACGGTNFVIDSGGDVDFLLTSPSGFGIGFGAGNITTVANTSDCVFGSAPGHNALLGLNANAQVKCNNASIAGVWAVEIDVASTGTFALVHGVTNILTVSAVGLTTLSCVSGQKVTITNGTAAITIGTTGQVVIADSSAGGPKITFKATTPGNWIGSPTDNAVAINRIAAAVAGLLGGPIP